MTGITARYDAPPRINNKVLYLTKRKKMTKLFNPLFNTHRILPAANGGGKNTQCILAMRNKQHITVSSERVKSIPVSPRKEWQTVEAENAPHVNQNVFSFPKYSAKKIRTDFLSPGTWRRKSERIFFPQVLGEENQNGFRLSAKPLYIIIFLLLSDAK
jgi:hypothetical protein